MSPTLPEPSKGPFSEPAWHIVAAFLRPLADVNDFFSFVVHRSIWTYSTICLSIQLSYVSIKLPTAISPEWLLCTTDRSPSRFGRWRKGGTEAAWMSRLQYTTKMLKPYYCPWMPVPALLHLWSIIQHLNTNKFSAIYSSNSSVMGHQGLKPTLSLLSLLWLSALDFPSGDSFHLEVGVIPHPWVNHLDSLHH